MRTHLFNPKKNFAVQAYAGTTGILLAMNVTESKRKGLLGFAIQRRARDSQIGCGFKVRSAV